MNMWVTGANGFIGRHLVGCWLIGAIAFMASATARSATPKSIASAWSIG